MNQHRKKMQLEWKENTRKYPNPIGTTGRRPEEDEFQETVDDVSLKLKLDSLADGAILDAGSSNGYLMKRLAPRAKIITGIDFCHEPLIQGKELYPEMMFAQGEITQLPFSDQMFDRIISYSLFHYLPSHEIVFKATAELFRILAPGGRLMIGDLLSQDHRHLIPKDDQERWSSKERAYMHQIQNWTFVSLEKMCDLLKQLGAQSVEVLSQVRQKRVNQYRFDIVADKKVSQ